MSALVPVHDTILIQKISQFKDMRNCSTEYN